MPKYEDQQGPLSITRELEILILGTFENILNFHNFFKKCEKQICLYEAFSTGSCMISSLVIVTCVTSSAAEISRNIHNLVMKNIIFPSCILIF